jgi:hypothetical protein
MSAVNCRLSTVNAALTDKLSMNSRGLTGKRS